RSRLVWALEFHSPALPSRHFVNCSIQGARVYPMKQIPPHPIWLGHVGEAEAFGRLFDLGIEAVVQLAAEEPPLPLPRELILCHFPLIDGIGNRAALLSLAVE